MSQSASAYLVYGYILGGPEGGWYLKEVGEYEGLDVPWYDGENEDFHEDFPEAVEKILLDKIAGFTKTWQDEGYYKDVAPALKKWA